MICAEGSAEGALMSGDGFGAGYRPLTDWPAKRSAAGPHVPPTAEPPISGLAGCFRLLPCGAQMRG